MCVCVCGCESGCGLYVVKPFTRFVPVSQSCVRFVRFALGHLIVGVVLLSHLTACRYTHPHKHRLGMYGISCCVLNVIPDCTTRYREIVNSFTQIFALVGQKWHKTNKKDKVKKPTKRPHNIMIKIISISIVKPSIAERRARTSNKDGVTSKCSLCYR